MVRLFLAILLSLFYWIPASGMEFTWQATPATGETVASLHIRMSGEIRTGDADRFKDFVNKNLAKYKDQRYIELSSNGGNLIEALRMSELLRQMYPSIRVTGDCASACFYLYLSGATRFVDKSSRLGVHRAYFDKAYFANLPMQTAKKKQTETASILDRILEENGVPQNLREIMNRTPSSDVYWLSREEISTLGIMPAWYEEFMIAKCDYGEFLKQKKRFQEALKKEEWEVAEEIDTAGPYIKYGMCENKLIKEELARLPSLLAKKSN